MINYKIGLVAKNVCYRVFAHFHQSFVLRGIKTSSVRWYWISQTTIYRIIESILKLFGFKSLNETWDLPFQCWKKDGLKQAKESCKMVRRWCYQSSSLCACESVALSQLFVISDFSVLFTRFDETAKIESIRIRITSQFPEHLPCISQFLGIIPCLGCNHFKWTEV